MYNRYIPNGEGHTRVEVNEETQCSGPDPKYVQVEGGGASEGRQPRQDSGNSPLGGMLDGLKLGKLGEFLERDKSGGLKTLLGALGLDEIDTGDILLMLIVLFLLTEGDNLDLVITLGLMILLGLGGKKPDGGEPSGGHGDR